MKDEFSNLYNIIIIDNKIDKIQIILPTDSNLNVYYHNLGYFRNENNIFII